MIFWYWYLLAVAALSFAGYITVNIYLTAGLAAAVHLLFRFFPAKKRFITGLEAVVVAAAALALLWRESFLAPVSTLVSFLTNPKTRPTAKYMLEFAMQFVNLWMLAAGLALFAAAFFLARKKPLLLALAAYIVFASAWIAQPKHNMAELDNEAEEAAPAPQTAAQPKPNIAETDSFYNRIAEFSAPASTQASAQAWQNDAELASASPNAFFKKERGKVVQFQSPSKDGPPTQPPAPPLRRPTPRTDGPLTQNLARLYPRSRLGQHRGVVRLDTGYGHYQAYSRFESNSQSDKPRL